MSVRTTLVVVLTAYLCTTAASSPPGPATDCRIAGAPAVMADLPEASGLAASHSIPDLLWALNDSGEAMVFALNRGGAVVSRVRLQGAKVDDWEAIAVGPCARGSCLYVGDIGDNRARRRQITIYSVPEPNDPKDSTAAVSAFHAVYPDEPQDAEALLATPDGFLYIVSKGSTGPIAIYRVPRQRLPGSTVTLERIGTPRTQGKVASEDRITDGALSPDGMTTVLRTHRALLFYRTARLLSGDWRDGQAVSIASLKEPQGEGVALGRDGAIYVSGEGGGKSAPGTFARLTCTPLLWRQK